MNSRDRGTSTNVKRLCRPGFAAKVQNISFIRGKRVLKLLFLRRVTLCVLSRSWKDLRGAPYSINYRTPLKNSQSFTFFTENQWNTDPIRIFLYFCRLLSGVSEGQAESITCASSLHAPASQLPSLRETSQKNHQTTHTWKNSVMHLA